MTRIAGLTGVVLALGVSATPASARPVTLWSCHGPQGQPLGSAGLTATQGGDGTASSGGGCDGGAGGLVASFSRPDPAGGSAASWRVETPAQTVLLGARVQRAITTAAAPYGPGVSQRYVVRSDSALLETINLLDVWATPPGTFIGAASGGSISAGVDCARPTDERCVAATAGSVTVGAIALDVDDPAAPRGSVGGLRSPVRGAFTLEIDAADDGVGLATAQALLDGAPIAEGALDAACGDLDGATAVRDIPLGGCVRQVTRAPLLVDLTGQPVGAHRLQVRVTDGAGNQADLYNGEIAVAGPDPIFTPTVQLTVGDPRPKPTTPVGGSGTQAPAGTVPQCPRPRLSMVLDQRPVRVARGRPVLRAGARYRFRGRLTCRAGTVRRSAARGTPVEILNRVGRRTFGVTGATVTTGGRLTVILSYRSSRTLIFRHRSTNGTSQVRIPVTVVRKKARR